jgi:RNA polymerase sigma factor (TIGR02999 family)
MNDITYILGQIDRGDTAAAEQLLPLVYDELRRLAAARMSAEPADHTLQATALVHEAYLRLVDVERARHWDSRGHFFAAAAEAMRRILVEQARRKQSRRQGGDWCRVEIHAGDLAVPTPDRNLLEIDEALTRLAEEDPQSAELVKLRLFAGLSVTDAAGVLGVSRSTAYKLWAYARAWLQCALDDRPGN